ncbi:MAG: HTH domain-containing protein, partial [Clostridia bacterium]|nr:HTH domain-containing protein [Clostridia bacterium]
MNERCAQLINMLMSRGKTVKVSDLAGALKLSSRTIRYDLDKIDDFLKKNQLPQLTRKPHSGIKYTPSTCQRQKIHSLLEGLNSYDYILTPQERKRNILAELFKAKDYITIEDMATHISVSRGTVLNDLRDIRQWFLNQGLRLESLPHFGI